MHIYQRVLQQVLLIDSTGCLKTEIKCTKNPMKGVKKKNKESDKWKYSLFNKYQPWSPKVKLFKIAKYIALKKMIKSFPQKESLTLASSMPFVLLCFWED